MTDIIRLLLFTGCRKSEITGLGWSEVQDDGLVLADSKTGPRTVPLGSQARAILDALASGEAITIARFGTFTTRDRAARQGRNPRTGEAITIAASRTPSFKAGKTLCNAVNR